MDWLLPGLSLVPNVHPMLVHFPIAFWLGALLLSGLGVWRAKTGLFEVGRLLLHLGTLSGAVAIVSGYLAAAELGHSAPGHELVHVHRNWMIVASGLSLAISIVMFAFRNRHETRSRLAQVGLLAGLAAVVTLGADRGAALVYGYGVGVRGEAPASQGEQGAHESTPHTHEHK